MKPVRMLVLSLALAALTVGTAAAAGHYPCSGSKGGVVRCVDGKFLCKDGSYSQSKRVCNATELKNVRAEANGTAKAAKKTVTDKSAAAKKAASEKKTTATNAVKAKTQAAKDKTDTARKTVKTVKDDAKTVKTGVRTTAKDVRDTAAALKN